VIREEKAESIEQKEKVYIAERRIEKIEIQKKKQD